MKEERERLAKIAPGPDSSRTAYFAAHVDASMLKIAKTVTIARRERVHFEHRPALRCTKDRYDHDAQICEKTIQAACGQMGTVEHEDTTWTGEWNSACAA